MSEKYNFNEENKKDAEEHGVGGDGIFYKLQDGNKNVCRILTPLVAYATYFIGKGSRPAVAYGLDKGDPRSGDLELKKSIRYVGYVLDKTDNKVRQAEFPYSIHKGIGVLQENPDYQFDVVPMPYDIRITYAKDESPANMYNVQATPNRDEISDEIIKDLEKKMKDYTPEKVIQKKKDDQIKLDKEKGVWISPEEVQKHKDKIKAELEEAKKNGTSDSGIEYPEGNPEDIPF